MTTAEARLQERAAGLEVRELPDGGHWLVRSGSEPGLWHNVRQRGEGFAGLTCSCQGGRGRCAHKVAVAMREGMDIPEPASGRRNAARTPSAPEPDVSRVVWLGAITDRATAIQASGALEGGGRVTLDVPDDATGALGALIGMRRHMLRITVEVVRLERGDD